MQGMIVKDKQFDAPFLVLHVYNIGTSVMLVCTPVAPDVPEEAKGELVQFNVNDVKLVPKEEPTHDPLPIQAQSARDKLLGESSGPLVMGGSNREMRRRK